jgi:hypothetical protein
MNSCGSCSVLLFSSRVLMSGQAVIACSLGPLSGFFLLRVRNTVAQQCQQWCQEERESVGVRLLADSS